MVAMVRKQLYLGADHDRRLKAAARATGRTEAQVVRDALQVARPSRLRPDDAAWDEALAFMRSRSARKGARPAPRADRETIYREMTRHGLRAR
jgi:hypothetical protein